MGSESGTNHAITPERYIWFFAAGHHDPAPARSGQGQPLPPAVTPDPHPAEGRDAVITGITEITYIHTKQDMSRWTRAHEKSERITWSVFPGPGGTMIIVEHEEDRATLLRRQSLPADIDVARDVAATMAAVSDNAENVRAAAAGPLTSVPA